MTELDYINQQIEKDKAGKVEVTFKTGILPDADGNKRIDVPSNEKSLFVNKKRIGAGGMGTVYEVYSPTQQRRMALKVLDKVVTSDPSQSNSTEAARTERFHKEIATLATVQDPNVVPILDFLEVGDNSDLVGLTPGSECILMPLLDTSKTVSKQIEKGSLDVSDSIEIIKQVAGCVDRMEYKYGIVHRDIKPGNIVYIKEVSNNVVVKQEVQVMDFGLASLTSSADDKWRGTPQYMAPERWREKPETSKSDQYSLGVTAYEALVGKRPFGRDAQTSAAIGVEILQNDGIPFERAMELKKALIAKKCSEKQASDAINTFGRVFMSDPEQRFETATDFAQQLARDLGQPDTMVIKLIKKTSE